MEKSLESLKLCDSDYRFMMIVWENAPVKSGELVGLCKEKLEIGRASCRERVCEFV